MGEEVFLENDNDKAAPSAGTCASETGDFLLVDELALLILSTCKVAEVTFGDGNFVLCLFAPMGVSGRTSIIPDLAPRSRSWWKTSPSLDISSSVVVRQTESLGSEKTAENENPPRLVRQ